ncbi:NUDIX hydrolase [Fulvivirga sediminis]|uniref:NUDIX hydrolase n=1 Tax=Fulvivirga sediminis TaxID=2803949 RepID=A0A937JYT5_9BACT|nr:NUDIX domain-containing protein [Fulvivirga sediminis]MBL3655989.1 NUDIX hydrolase [Fulvivirga sediminis]
MTLQKSNSLNPHVSVDCVIFGFDKGQLQVLLIKRGGKDEALALPGDLIRDDENLDEAASRVLYELTGLRNIFLEQLRAFGDPERLEANSDIQWLNSVREEPQARVITIAYYAIVKPGKLHPKPSSFASEVKWMPVLELPMLAFDHSVILSQALHHLAASLKKEPLLAFEMLPRKFTLRQIQKLYEEVLNKNIDKRNFRKKLQTAGMLIPLDEKEVGVSHKPARFYQFDKKKIKTKGWL